MLKTAHPFTSLLIVASSVCLFGAEPINTPFELVPLWSEEMLSHLTGATQPACSGPNAAACERLDTGTCEDAAYFTLPGPNSGAGVKAPFVLPARQTNSANPRPFKVLIANASRSAHSHQLADEQFETIDLVFDCQFGDNDMCLTLRFHVGTVHAVEIGLANGEKAVDLTRSATVRPDGTVAVRVGPALRDSLLSDRRAMYKVSATVECFSVRPSPIEWAFPLHEGPSSESRTLGTVVARLTHGRGIDFVYRPIGGPDAPFDTDWVEEDWGYTYLREQTVLDRKGDWFLLPPRPFPGPVWIRLPVRNGLSTVSARTVYSLSKRVAARESGGTRTVTLDEGNIVVVARHGRALEIRKEEEFDGPCATSDERGKAQKLPTYLVEAEEFYDQDLHFQLEPAYTRGC